MTEVTRRPALGTETDPRSGRPLLTLPVERRPVDARDTAFLRDLFADSRDDLLLLPSDTRDLIVDMQFRTQRRQWRLENPDAAHELLLVRGVRAGHVLVAEDAGTIELVDLVVRVGFRGLGIGGDVVAELADDADRSRRVIRLRVWAGNGAARRFFSRHGFAPAAVVGGFLDMVRPPAE
ncbi:Acetyltransferase (GNAT) family protein [Jatrophihabitans endophyticus]|uniref:Acetyltransferase (GNAT) family protein n=1 Tax=Jatrophihabitans endophyticus TaxID=1206085 RepID=A0A1M5TF78_9ACTN|nr:GNAT family N-acetyltransferase [Jatrophihabitans endophyticus]SHH49364.1 Acetyltransferase (GNAT) family protein [Jatrophihabitans endophyticus]